MRAIAAGAALALVMAWSAAGRVRAEACTAGAGGSCSAPAQPTRAPAQPTVELQLLGLNDFHGQLGPGKRVHDRPAGGAAVLASYLRAETARFPGETLIVHAGDWVGASPPNSGLLQDEPAISVLNLLANRHCTRARRLHPRCNIVGTPGNHEFDEGVPELLRLLRGGNAERGPFLERPYRGARFPYVSATVVRARSARPLLPPFVIKEVGGVRVAIIGAVLAATPTMVVPEGVRGVRFLDEVAAIDEAVRQVRRRGIETIIVTIHQGSAQPPYAGWTQPGVRGPEGEIATIVAGLADAVDVVVSGHAHAFTNALMPNRNGHEVLVVQALSAGTAYAVVELAIDRASRDVVRKRARIVPTYADEGPGLTPAPDVAALVARADAAVAPLVQRVVGSARAEVRETLNEAGESALGNLIADAHRHAARAQIAFMNQGGIRTGLDAGAITWGELFAIHPFGNRVVRLELTGAQVLRLLEQQWEHTPARRLQVSGLSYVWDPQRPVGARVVSVEIDGAALAPRATYRVAVNSFLATGGGGFGVLAEGKRRKAGNIDLEALVAYIAAQRAPLEVGIEGRVRIATTR